MGLLASMGPAWQAARIRPRVLLTRSAQESGLRRRLPLFGALGLGMAFAAILLAWMPGGCLIAGFGSLTFAVFAWALWTPGLLGLMSAAGAAALRGIRGATAALGRMAVREARASLSRTGVAAAALMTALSVTVAMGVMVDSFRRAVTDWLESVLIADIYVSAPQNESGRLQGFLEPAWVDRARSLPGVAGSTTYLVAAVRTSGSRQGQVQLLALDMDVRHRHAFRFPDDHGPHPEYRSEWWYFTGNLRDSLDRIYGYQLTFFRSGLRPPPPDTGSGDKGRSSPWTADNIYMAHFALTEVGANRFHAHERFSRAAMGLAGAEAGMGIPFRVWLEDWRAFSEAGDTALFPLRLQASQGGASIDLVLEASKPMVLQGERGYSRKGPETGNASFYYSFTRMSSSGTVTTPGGSFSVSGDSWMDREWGGSILTPGLVGWKWFGLRLADSTEYLFFRLRKAGPRAAGEDSVAFDYGIRIGPRGNTRRYGPGDLEARILSRWTSPRAAPIPPAGASACLPNPWIWKSLRPSPTRNWTFPSRIGKAPSASGRGEKGGSLPERVTWS